MFTKEMYYRFLKEIEANELYYNYFKSMNINTPEDLKNVIPKIRSYLINSEKPFTKTTDFSINFQKQIKYYGKVVNHFLFNPSIIYITSKGESIGLRIFNGDSKSFISRTQTHGSIKRHNRSVKNFIRAIPVNLNLAQL